MGLCSTPILGATTDLTDHNTRGKQLPRISAPQSASEISAATTDPAVYQSLRPAVGGRGALGRAGGDKAAQDQRHAFWRPGFWREQCDLRHLCGRGIAIGRAISKQF